MDPLAALQTEYSLFERGVEEAGIFKHLTGPWNWLCSLFATKQGFLNGVIQSPGDFPANDFKKTIPGFQGETFYKNLELVNEIKMKKRITASQLAIAWVIAKGAAAIPVYRIG